MGNISKPTAIQAKRIEDMNTKQIAELLKITKEIITDNLLHHYCIKNCKAFGLYQTT